MTIIKDPLYLSDIKLEEIRPLLRSITALSFNLALPGSGLILLGRWRLALLTQAALATTLATLCWSRLIFAPWAVQVALVVMAVIYLASALACLSHKLDRPGYWLQTMGFVTVCVAGLATGFIYKQHWLGVGIYFVPSISMHPTLKPGEFILVDTWAYRQDDPQKKDVVVFRQSESPQ